MRHRHGLRKLNRTSSHRQAMFRNMCRLAAAPRSHQDHAAQGQGTAPRRRAPDHARQGADAGQPPPRLRPPARPRDRHEAVRRAGPAVQGASGRLHPHPEDGLPQRRQRADGVRRTGRALARRRSGHRHVGRLSSRSQRSGSCARRPAPAGLFHWRAAREARRRACAAPARRSPTTPAPASSSRRRRFGHRAERIAGARVRRDVAAEQARRSAASVSLT